MRYLYKLLLLGLLSFPVVVKGQVSQKAREILQQSIKAQGGEAKLRDVRSLELQTRSDFNGKTIFSIFKKQAPDKMRVEIHTLDGRVLKIYNAGKGYSLMNGKKEELSKNDLQDMREEARIFPELYFEQEGYQMTSLGEREYAKGSVETKLVSPSGNVRYYYFDKDSHFLTKIIDEQTQTTTLLDKYKAFGGIYFPTRLTLRFGSGEMVLQVLNVELNRSIPETDFSVE
ncbi:MAG: hypothetical protein MI784_08620 [Cytophagales bacterium]|nr:hypothetical protein [Cytophagales bacterium]